MKRLTQFFTAAYHNPWVRTVALTAYYLAIILGLVVMYGKGDLTAPKFVYQGF